MTDQDQMPVTVQKAVGRYTTSAQRISARIACFPSTKNVPWLLETCTSTPRRTASSEKLAKSPTSAVFSVMACARATDSPQIRSGPASDGLPQM
jgi:hypothetical protein